MKKIRNKKILAIDWGLKRIGLAKPDPTYTIAIPLPTLNVKSYNDAIFSLRKIIDEEKAEILVVGDPLNEDGEETPFSKKMKKFFEKLLQPYYENKKNIKVIYVDERLTSWEALTFLKEKGEKDLKSKIDQIVATRLLQNYLDELKMKKLEEKVNSNFINEMKKEAQLIKKMRFKLKKERLKKKFSKKDEKEKNM